MRLHIHRSPPGSGHGQSTHLPRLLSPCSGQSALSLGGRSLCVTARRTALVFRTKSKPSLIPTALWEAVLPSPQRPFGAHQCLTPRSPQQVPSGLCPPGDPILPTGLTCLLHSHTSHCPRLPVDPCTCSYPPPSEDQLCVL